MKKLAIICVMVFTLVAINGCGGNNVFDLGTQSSEKIADNQMESFLHALESRDTEHLISLFAPSVLSEVEDLQNTIDLLYSYYQGKYSCYNNWGATNTSTTRNNNRVMREIYGTYDVVTDVGVYRFAFLYIDTDSAVADNVGLQSIYIIKMDDDTDPQYAYRGDDMYTPGIQIGIQNSIPDELQSDGT